MLRLFLGLLISPFILSCTTSHDLRASKPEGATTPALQVKDSPKIAVPVPSVASDPTREVGTALNSVHDSSGDRVRSRNGGSGDSIKALSFAKVADGLGLSEAEARSQVVLLDRMLQGQRYAERSCLGVARAKNKSLCSFLTVLNRSTQSSFRSSYKPYVPIQPRYFSFQQKLPYEQVRKSLHPRSASEVLSWVPNLARAQGCPRNLSVAAVRKLEELLPNSKAIRSMELLYKHASQCLKPSDSHYEFFHFRQALLRHLWKMPEKARTSIRLATKATEYFERDRVLYWAGYLETDPQQRNLFWGELVDDHPLSYHALEAWKHLKQDPYMIYTQKPELIARRHVKGRQSLRAQQGIYWLEGLYLMGRRQSANILSARLMKRFADVYTPNNIYYVASLKEEKNNTLSTIGFLSNQTAILNEQTLKMLFPKPYFSHFESVWKKRGTDPYLLLAVTRQESAFNPRARSQADARGLMQILPGTARNLSGRRWNNLYHPGTNIDLGAKYMAQLISKFGSVEKALAGYNAGPRRVDVWDRRYPARDTTLYMDLIPFKETRNYVAKIVRNNYWYERIYDQPRRSVASIAMVPKSELVGELVSSHKKYASSSFVR